MNVKLYAEVLAENLFKENGNVDKPRCDTHGFIRTDRYQIVNNGKEWD